MSFLFGRSALMPTTQPPLLTTTQSTRLPISAGVVSWAGAAVGDLAVVFTFNSTQGNLTPPAGWTTDSVALSGWATQVFTKVLTAADIAAGSGTWTAGGGFQTNSYAITAAYRGASAATRKSTASASATTLAIPGYTKTGLASGLVSFVGTEEAVTPLPPSPFTSEISGTFGADHAAMADLLNAARYADGASVTWTGFTGASVNYGWLLELTP